jgi:Virulence-associated protein E
MNDDISELLSIKIVQLKDDIESTRYGSDGKVIQDFDTFKKFFEGLFIDVRKCPLSGIAYTRDHTLRTKNFIPIENLENTITGYAARCGLNRTLVKGYLHNYIDTVLPNWLFDIPQWDGVDRLKQICDSTELNNCHSDCFYEFILDWGAGVFRRAEDNHYQNKFIILRGAQGIGKDFFIKTICKGFGTYFGNWVNTREQREMLSMMAQRLVLNIPEFDSTHQNEVPILKDIITRYEATYRAPYERHSQSRLIRTSFISSSNASYLLRDQTGNRRFAIFDINKFGLMNNFDQFDGSQILSQFKRAYDQNFKVADKHKVLMDSYIEAMTPPSSDDIAMEIWNEEIEGIKRLMVNPEDWLPLSSVAHVFEKIRKVTGFKMNHMSSLLRSRGCRKKTNKCQLYKEETLKLTPVGKDDVLD